MIEKVILPVIIMAAGMFSAVCALKDMEWFMTHRKAQFMVGLIGRTGTRIFYTALGAALFAAGAIMLMVGLQNS